MSDNTVRVRWGNEEPGEDDLFGWAENVGVYPDNRLKNPNSVWFVTWDDGYVSPHYERYELDAIDKNMALVSKVLGTHEFDGMGLWSVK